MDIYDDFIKQAMEFGEEDAEGYSAELLGEEGIKDTCARGAAQHYPAMTYEDPVLTPEVLDGLRTVYSITFNSRVR